MGKNNNDRTNENKDYYNRHKQNQDDKNKASYVATGIIVALFMIGSAMGGGQAFGMIGIIVIIGTIIGLSVYCTNCDERNGIPKTNRSSAYVKEYYEKKGKVGCKYGFPQYGDSGYEACQKELKALDKEYNG